MTEYEIIQVLGHLLDERLEHVAKKTDMVRMDGKLEAVQKSFDAHLAQHEKSRAFLVKMKIIALGGIVTGLISAGFKWFL